MVLMWRIIVSSHPLFLSKDTRTWAKDCKHLPAAMLTIFSQIKVNLKKSLMHGKLCFLAIPTMIEIKKNKKCKKVACIITGRCLTSLALIHSIFLW